MIVFGVDPGQLKSAWCCFDTVGRRVIWSGYEDNVTVRRHLRGESSGALVIEMVQCYGSQMLGAPLFETCVWIGQFKEAGRNFPIVATVLRPEAARHLCYKSNVKDGAMNQALRDKLGEKGTKKCPGPLFGIHSHIWSALAVAVTWVETSCPPALSSV